MAVRVGTDVIEIERIRRALERPGFRDRCFTRAEQDYCESRRNPAESYAARFCGKEAVGKALGCGVLFTWKEIEIVGPPKPGVTLAGKTLALRRARRDARDRRLADALAHGGRRRPASPTSTRRSAAAAALTAMYEPLFTAAEMRAAEERYPGYPETAGELMERAGAAVAAEAMRAFPDARRFAVVCGGGVERRRRADRGAHAARGRAARPSRRTTPRAPTSSIDALFGTGFHGAPRPRRPRSIERINACGAPVVAVDLPSGVDASTGEVAGAAVEADLTVTFHARKLGLVVAPGRFHAGQVVVADIGLEHRRRPPPSARSRRCSRASRASGRATRSSRPASLLVVGGAPGTTSAPVLSARAALRADAGYVDARRARACLAVAETLALEPVKRGFDWGDALETLAPELERATARRDRPGPRPLRRGARARARAPADASTLPVVVDADGLFGLEPVEREAPLVLTPHAGELARLLDTDSDWVAAHRLEAAARVRRALPRRRPPQGRRHDRARARRAHRRLRPRARPRSRPPARATC